MKRIGLLLVAVVLTACALPSHNNTLVFAVNRDVGFGVSSGPTDAGVNVNLGYKSRELAWVPLWANMGGDAMPCGTTARAVNSGAVSGPSTVSATQTGSFDCMRGPKFVADSDVQKGSSNEAHDAYSTFASFGGSFAGAGSSGGPEAKAQVQLASFFATGVAAQHLAKTPGVAMTAAPASAAESTNKPREQPKAELPELVTGIEERLKDRGVSVPDAEDPTKTKKTVTTAALTAERQANCVAKVGRDANIKMPASVRDVGTDYKAWMSAYAAWARDLKPAEYAALQAAALLLDRQIDAKANEDGRSSLPAFIESLCKPVKSPT